jgi:GT2 family glycosyltransferase
VDLSRRILDAGWTLYYLREAEIVHLVGTAGDGGHSRFSILMRCDSTAKLIGKHQGAFAAGRYRVAVVAGAVARLLGVAALTTAAAVRPRARGRDWRASARKYGWMIQWALGSARPEVKG